MPLTPAEKELHPWYRGRLRVLKGELDRLELPNNPRILDAGCGAGGVLSELARRGVAVGVDAAEDAVDAARRRGQAAMVGNLRELPFPDAQFDFVACLDVLEHVPDDRGVLVELARVSRPGASLLVTVPANPALWSSHDEAAGHRRRYTREELERVAKAAGWQARRRTHFNTLLFAATAVMRLAERLRRRPRPPRSDLTVGPRRALRILEAALAAEARFLRGGGQLPFGLSLLAVFEKGPR